MIDFIKSVSENQIFINRLHDYANSNLKTHKAQNNNYMAYSNGSARLRLEFRKVFAGGMFAGFRNVEVCFSPHYKFNNDLHNGNDFNPTESIKTIIETFLVLGINSRELQEFKVVNLEYGLNIITGIKIESIIDGLLFTNKTAFKTKNFPYFKISDSTKYKEIKAYAKGLQFIDHPKYKIDRETFRFEVKTKKFEKIKTLGIHTIEDLTDLSIYNSLFQSILDEWENVLIVNNMIKNNANKIEFWNELKHHRDRNKFTKSKVIYYKNLESENNLHLKIKVKIIDKIIELQKGAYCPQKTPINIDKLYYPIKSLH